MTTARFRPRDCARTPAAFGYSREIRWADESGASDDRLDQIGTAKLQHEFAYRIRDALAARDLTVKDFAEMEGQDYFRWRRLLRGEIIMRLEDVTRVERSLELRLVSEHRYGSRED
ncbi:ribosome-binding protein aMBF1 (putative translation factor) [Cryobacterium mesophilum]|uniref:Helix-turn-helix domain-containing protein n=1 Tax=Terrimesophilobacter mesophilus TaxID=433647 RepID=A0A4V3IAB4_9MICO|nr:hypothetical protein [Terrimesophilobacter mesophilus]MBB5633121.1 ribosome-binding protein aMBF1 (putative translation factor) [Terrimesophilobacter mesophilus]TFB79878.1 hypothetical protein E3N84_07375 [Terrimesophilobacter mesophilus]